MRRKIHKKNQEGDKPDYLENYIQDSSQSFNVICVGHILYYTRQNLLINNRIQLRVRLLQSSEKKKILEKLIREGERKC